MCQAALGHWRSGIPGMVRFVDLQAADRAALEKVAASPSVEYRLVERSQIILRAAAGKPNREISKELGVHRNTVSKWRCRFDQRRRDESDKPMIKALADADRLGPPGKFSAEFWVDVLALATKKPEDCGRPITHWTHAELTDEILLRDLTDSIHPSTVGRFLQQVQLRPHRVQEWMNRPEDPEFDDRATNVKDRLVEATTGTAGSGRAVVSFDEKTGMQAKERIAPDQPPGPGRLARLEFEYARHGTRVLFALLVTQEGMIRHRIRPNRTNEVTAAVLESLLADLQASGYSHIDVILDQLNTHWSVDLVETMARLCQLPAPPAEEIQTGQQRRDWLERSDKSIVFHFTPKHASWLNPIEIWFGVLVAKVLRRGSFQDCDHLEARIGEFIDYYNRKLAHPYCFSRWYKAA